MNVSRAYTVDGLFGHASTGMLDAHALISVVLMVVGGVFRGVGLTSAWHTLLCCAEDGAHTEVSIIVR